MTHGYCSFLFHDKLSSQISQRRVTGCSGDEPDVRVTCDGAPSAILTRTNELIAAKDDCKYILLYNLIKDIL